MSTITISDLHPNGFDLFQDSDSYLNELADEELNMTYGGVHWTVRVSVRLAIAGSVISIVGTLIAYSVAQYTPGVAEARQGAIDAAVEQIP